MVCIVKSNCIIFTTIYTWYPAVEMCLGPGDGIHSGPEVPQRSRLHYRIWQSVPFSCCSMKEGVVKDVFLHKFPDFVVASGFDCLMMCGTLLDQWQSPGAGSCNKTLFSSAVLGIQRLSQQLGNAPWRFVLITVIDTRSCSSLCLFYVSMMVIWCRCILKMYLMISLLYIVYLIFITQQLSFVTLLYGYTSTTDRGEFL